MYNIPVSCGFIFLRGDIMVYKNMMNMKITPDDVEENRNLSYDDSGYELDDSGMIPKLEELKATVNEVDGLENDLANVKVKFYDDERASDNTDTLSALDKREILEAADSAFLYADRLLGTMDRIADSLDKIADSLDKVADSLELMET